jgi:lipoyl(octanoyl) transferase
MKQVLFKDLGQNQSYQEIWNLQEKVLQQKVAVKSALRNAEPEIELTNTYQEETADNLFFVEHNPVYTLGKSGDISHVLISNEQRQERGIEFFKINRGGDITFHGPGQLVGYPIIDLEQFKADLGWYLRSLEEVIILTMAEYGLKGERSPGETGVWLDPNIAGKARKICAMGIRCSRWITMHGFAFNVNTDLDYFNYIIPCGIQNKQVTSLERELGFKLPMDEVKQKVIQNFERVFQVDVITGKKEKDSI